MGLRVGVMLNASNKNIVTLTCHFPSSSWSNHENPDKLSMVRSASFWTTKNLPSSSFPVHSWFRSTPAIPSLQIPHRSLQWTWLSPCWWTSPLPDGIGESVESRIKWAYSARFSRAFDAFCMSQALTKKDLSISDGKNWLVKHLASWTYLERKCNLHEQDWTSRSPPAATFWEDAPVPTLHSRIKRVVVVSMPSRSSQLWTARFEGHQRWAWWCPLACCWS